MFCGDIDDDDCDDDDDDDNPVICLLSFYTEFHNSMLLHTSSGEECIYHT